MIKILNSVFMGHLHHQSWKQHKYCLMFILRAVLFLNIDNFHLIAIIYHLYLTRLLPKELSITLMFNGQSIKLFILNSDLDGIFPALVQKMLAHIWYILVNIFQACISNRYEPFLWSAVNVVFFSKNRYTSILPIYMSTILLLILFYLKP